MRWLMDYVITLCYDAFQVEYQKQKRAVIDNYRGFQTMDSNDHPVVQQGIKAAELMNEVGPKLKMATTSSFGITVSLNMRRK